MRLEELTDYEFESFHDWIGDLIAEKDHDPVARRILAGLTVRWFERRSRAEKWDPLGITESDR